MRMLVAFLMLLAVVLAEHKSPAKHAAKHAPNSLAENGDDKPLVAESNEENPTKDARCGFTRTTASGTHAPNTICAGDLIYEDNFGHFDHHKWQHEITLGGGGNWEFQYYNNNRTNSYVRDGRLYITPSLLSDQYGEPFLTSGRLHIDGGGIVDRCTNSLWYGCDRTGSPNNILNPIKSARIRTINSFRFKYGRVEVSAKLPAGDWLWPAIWLMPAFDEYGTWPASGEIDLMESRGNRNLMLNGVNIGAQQVGSTLHYGPYVGLNGWDRTHFSRNRNPGYNEQFHRYQLWWTPDFIRFSIDDIVLGQVTPPAGGFWQYGAFSNAAPGVQNPWRYASKMAPFDQEFYLLINLACGGVAYFPDQAQNPTGKPWWNGSPQAATDFWAGRSSWLPTWNLNVNDEASLQVQYVRVWAL